MLIRGIGISVTQRCNVHYFHCRREGDDAANDTTEMSADKIKRIAGVTSASGIEKIKLTARSLIRDHVITEINTVLKKRSDKLIE